MEAQIAQIASTYLENVRPTGQDGLRARCPFCGSNRSFIISSRHGGWLCFSCDERGSLVMLLRRAGMGRRQIDRVVGQMKLEKPVSDKVRRRRQIRETWSILPEYILSAYENEPTMLLEQGFDVEVLQAHDVGMDLTHQRITFAIRDQLGRLAGISGRATNDSQVPRYKVYDASPPDPRLKRKAGEFYGVVDNYVPDNRKHLYGFNSVFPERYFKPEDAHPPLIISEGYKSTLWLRQMGMHHAVGLQGSSLTDAQALQLGKLRGPYYVMLDNESGKTFPDRNGRCAALDIARHLRRSGRVYICLYADERPAGTAPDDIGNAEEINWMTANAKTIGELHTLR
jgi:DNA primase